MELTPANYADFVTAARKCGRHHGLINGMDKKYYKIKDVAEMLGIVPSTLRYWEQEFPECSPRRSASNQRYYTPRKHRMYTNHTLPAQS